MNDHQRPNDHDETKAFDPYARSAESFREPPSGFLATLKHLGPGMILVGSVVGSGELIMTTKLGAVAGFKLLWLVLFSCLIKVVVQGELVRHTISSGKTFLTVFNSLPGPRSRRPVWLNLEWMAVVLLSSYGALATYTNSIEKSTQSAILMIAEVLAIWILWAFWIRARRNRKKNRDIRDEKLEQRPDVNWIIWLWMLTVLIMFANGGAILGASGQALQLAFPNVFGVNGSVYWAVIVGLVAGSILIFGGYRTLERISISLVAVFTLITILCTFLIQQTGYAISPQDLREGLRFDIPLPVTVALVLGALAMYAGTGIGAAEMMTYTYWCVEKGYARNVGEPQPGTDWPKRAKGWIRVMYADVLITMVIYTVSTICFYLLGAAILNAQNLDPDGEQTISILQGVYTESLGNWAATLFVVGAFFVLFSTVVSGIAGSTRTLTDGLCVMGILDPKDFSTRKKFFHIFAVVSLVVQAGTYSLFENPPMMLMVTSIAAVTMYPVIGLGTIYLRHRDVDPRIVPGKVTTLWLWICGVALAIISPAAILLALAIDRGWISIGG
ncbi:MAG: Nramp family divalent metal transporter [Planctomycetes bacterium]|nr:Nramp family divalent metal transporter [Planctomycetota bacterium]